MQCVEIRHHGNVNAVDIVDVKDAAQKLLEKAEIMEVDSEDGRTSSTEEDQVTSLFYIVKRTITERNN